LGISIPERSPNLFVLCPKTIKNPKKCTVIKKSCTFAAENEYFLFTLKLKTMQEILNEIVPIIAEKLGVDPSEVTMEASFTNDLGADSLDTVELMMEFEKNFNLSIPDDQQESIQTVGDVVRLIEKMRAEN
jgi:acyl carrier protein